jgi:hypothetical protein
VSRPLETKPTFYLAHKAAVGAHARTTLAALARSSSIHAVARAARTADASLLDAISGGRLTLPAVARLEAFARGRCACAACRPGEEASP